MRDCAIVGFAETKIVERSDRDVWELGGEILKPSESTGPSDLARLIATIPGDKAFRPMSEGGCPLVANAGK
jgi:branched-chain amino acid transport system substrate-binding protein